MICERADIGRDCNIYSLKMQPRKAMVLSLVSTLFLATTIAGADPVRVRYAEGSVHGYLALRSLDGKLLAAGDLTQTVQHGRLISRLIYRFKDGSIDDDTAVFTQNGTFRLISDHRIQKGPMFPKPTELTIKASHASELCILERGNGSRHALALPHDDHRNIPRPGASAYSTSSTGLLRESWRSHRGNASRSASASS